MTSRRFSIKHLAIHAGLVLYNTVEGMDYDIAPVSDFIISDSTRLPMTAEVQILILDC